MANAHRQNRIARRTVASAAAVAAMGVLLPAQANAAELNILGNNVTVDTTAVDALASKAGLPTAGDVVGQASSFVPEQASDIATSSSSLMAPATESPSATTQAAAPAQSQPAPTVEPYAPTSGQAVVDAARSRIGMPYAWGAAGPNSFDCSGLTSWAYAQVGKSIPRTSQAQAAAGTPVSLSALQAGDIIAYYDGASHVGIYTGNGTIIDALNSGTPVAERDLHYMPIHSAVRF